MTDFIPQQPGDPGPIAMKLLQGYFWYPREWPAITLPALLPMGANIALDQINPPFAFFDNGQPSETQAFYQLTVFEIHEIWPENELLHQRALVASQQLAPLLNATPPGVGWSLGEDLRPV
jgi:hypothetical protein